ncbi:cytochrome c oxidase IV family protein [Nocardiopsis valliformis]|uniref:cytochrome c oxidase IV family protein n=1 Tax=Nocardiopsis valliformis TaxID=239974 RepID=UPI00034BB888|nr:cytochrome c oxidase IV family protein [Nocardiopsis valliformis]
MTPTSPEFPVSFLSPGPWAAPLPWVLLALTVTGLLFLIWRRYALPPLPALRQHAAFDNADLARINELRARAEDRLTEVGRLLATSGERVRNTPRLRRALDAHAAARRVHDGAGEDPDLAESVGVLVLLDLAEDHHARAVARRRGEAPEMRVHCYANPLHGTNTEQVDWREVGGTRVTAVPLCADCAEAVRTRRRPNVLPDRDRGRTVPYYKVPAERSVWAATGFGTLQSDLVERVLRGEHRG